MRDHPVNYVRFYAGAWRNGTALMGLEEEGLYIRICAFRWDTGRLVPRDRTTAARLLRINHNKYGKVLDALIASGHVRETEHGLVVDRAEHELEAAQEAAARADLLPAQGARRAEGKTSEESGRDLGAHPVSHSDRTPNVTPEVTPTLTQGLTPPLTPRVVAEKSQQILRAKRLEKEKEEEGGARARADASQSDQSEETENDRLWREATERGDRIKGHKTAKSARSIRSAIGELDGCRGITLLDGKLTISEEIADDLRDECPGIDVTSLCRRAADDLMKRRGYPSFGDAMAALRKQLDYAIQDGRAKPAPTRKGPSKPDAAAELYAYAKEMGYAQ